MKIALITDDYYPKVGGVANVLVNLYKGFQEIDHELYIFNPYTRSDNEFKIIEKKRYKFRDLTFFLRKKKFYYLIIYSFWKIIRDKKITLTHRLKIILYFLTKPEVLMRVIENTTRLVPYFKKIDFDLIISGQSGWILPLSFIISRIFKKKLITLAYGNDFLILNPLSLKTCFFKNTDKIIVISNQTKRIIKKMHHLTEKQLEVIHVGVNLENIKVAESKNEIRKAFNIGLETFVLLSVGRHVKRKNFDAVIKSIHEIKKLRPSTDIKYILIGEGEETPKLKSLAHNLKLEDIVEFIGKCESYDRNKYYKASDIFLMPSTTRKNDIEGFGIVFLEANYYKVPAIGTSTGGIVEAIIDNETGLLIKPNDLNDLIDKILFFYDNEEKRKEMGEKAYIRVIKNFSWKRIIEDYIKVFEDVNLGKK